MKFNSKIGLVLSLMAVILFTGCSYVEPKELGTVTDFQISVGGFGESSKTVVEVDNKSKYVIYGTFAQTGYKLCEDERYIWGLVVKENCFR